MNSVKQIIEDIQATTKRTEKEAILKKYKDEPLLKEILAFVYNPYIVTGISKKKLYKEVSMELVTKEIYNINELFEYLIENNSGRDVDIANVANYILKLEHDVGELVEKIVTKNLKIGVTEKTLNKVYGKDFIPTFEVMLAKNHKDHGQKVTGSFTLTEKMNGMRCTILKENGRVIFMTRQGQFIPSLIEIEEEAKKLPDNYFFDGELLAINKDNLESDALFRQTVSLARTDGDKLGLEYHIFDGFPLKEFRAGKSKQSYGLRRLYLERKIKDFKLIKLIPTLYKGKDTSKIEEILTKTVLQDKEGLMLNLNHRPYECNRTDAILKVVPYLKADVLVTEVVEGTNKNKGRLGAIKFRFKFEDATYISECGTGFTDKERKDYFNNPDTILGKIVTIEYKGITQTISAKEEVYNIRNASWKGIIRDDKTEISMH